MSWTLSLPLLLVLAAWRAPGAPGLATHVSNEMEYLDGEHRYSMPRINASAWTDGDGGGDAGVESTTVTASLSRVLDFYNTELLAANWKRVQKDVSFRCKGDVHEYIQGLVRGDQWALKMDDASGRYSTGWFWGNHFWTGSQSLCESIFPFIKSDTDLMNRTETDSGGLLPLKSKPSFEVSFYVLRVNLNSSFTTEERVVSVGLCLPWSCTDEDVAKILEGTSTASRRVSVRVENVRSQHQYFNIWHDATFRILSAATCVVVILLIFGTFYDYHVQKQKEKKRTESLDCSSFAGNGSNLVDKSIKLDVDLAESKIYNGKSGFYAVTNNNTVGSNNNSNESGTEEENNNVRGNDAQLPAEELRLRSGRKATLKIDKKFVACLSSRLLLAFSVRINLRNICDRSVGSDTISVIHGLKSISMAWVILGHTCIVAFKYSDNMEYRKVVQREFIFQTVTNGTFSVDTFFFTSGLLVSFLYFRTNAKGTLDPLGKKLGRFSSGLFHFFGLIIYRFFRLTAPYLFVLGVVEVSMKWFNYNSVFEPPTLDHINCPKYWWRNVLYINTLFSVDEMCMLWSWYLSDDTQFYVVGAVLLILATRHFKSSVSLLLLFMISSWITTGYVAYSNGHVPGADDPLALFDKIYDKPWTRFGPYLIGMAVGWYLFKIDCSIRMSRLTVMVGWLASSACLLSLVYGLYNVNLTPVTGAAYSSLSHSAWALGLSWIVVACTTGYGGYVNSILSATILYPFSRVTYCAYLVHPIVIRMMTMNMDHPLHLGKGVIAIIFLGQVVASYAFSFLISVAFEAPAVSMLRILTHLSPRKSRTSAPRD